MIKAVFFDLFFTLITPEYDEINNEYNLLNLAVKEWESYAEDDDLYKERALGYVDNQNEIIDKIVAKLPFDVNMEKRQQLLFLRQERMRRALTNVSESILDTLKEIKNRGIKICLISNADLIDRMFWNQSVLVPFFDKAIFSCDVGMLKPDPGIYQLAMNCMEVEPSESLFIGDGGSDELYGAKLAGMTTLISEALDVKNEEKRAQILKNADYCVCEFEKILDRINLHNRGKI